MANAGESSSPPLNVKPLIVRVKRKVSQSPVEALWLEINERPVKRPLLDFAKLSISDSSGKDELKPKKVLVQHVETVRTSQTTVEIVQSILPDSDGPPEHNKAKGEDRRHDIKKENSQQKQDQLLSKARKTQEVLAKNARFEQIWRSRKGDKEAVENESLHGMYQFYDVIRVDNDEISSGEVQKQEEMSLEDQRLLSSYLPLLREFIPSAATDIESDLSGNVSKQASTDGYVYDYYVVKDDMEIDDENVYQFPSVQVEDDNFYGLDESSETESYDSNAENHPMNDYPDEESDEDDEEDEEDEESDEVADTADSEEIENESDEPSEPDISLAYDFSGPKHDCYDDYDAELYYEGSDGDNFDCFGDDDGSEEDWR